MSFFTYVLYSSLLKKYYTGSTKDIKRRISYHNYSHKGFTSQASDWRLVFCKEFGTIQESRQLERKIKKRGAARFIYDSLI